MATIESKRVREVENDHTFVLEMKLEDLGQGPYFSMSILEYDRIVNIDGQVLTRNGWKDIEWVSLSRDEDTLNRLFPECAHLLRWHCWHLDRGEWYYMQNAMCHAGFGKYSKKNLDHLASTIAYGARPGESTEGIIDRAFLAGIVDNDQLTFARWLADRYPDVMKRFYRDMTILFDTYMFPKLIPGRHNEFAMYGL